MNTAITGMIQGTGHLWKTLSVNCICITVFIILVIALSCMAADSEWRYTKLTIPVSNDDPEQFGYMIWPEHAEPGMGPKSIILDASYAYVTDEVHGNVKRIDLTTGDLKSSSALRERADIAWPGDIAVFDSLVYVASNMVGLLYVLSTDLGHLYTLPLPRGNQSYFIEIADDSLMIYQLVGNYLTVVYAPDSIMTKYDTSIDFAFYKTPHGKRILLSEDSTSIKTDYHVLTLKSRFPDVLSTLDAINIDFNDSTLVYFDVNEKEFTLHVYRRGW